MGPSAVEPLWARYVEGGPLSEAEQESLLRTLSEDADLRDRLLDDLELDGMLRILGREAEADVFVRQVGDRLQAERDARPFVQGVQERIRRETARSPERRRRRPRRARDMPILVPALIAATVLLVPLLLLALKNESTPETAETAPTRPDARPTGPNAPTEDPDAGIDRPAPDEPGADPNEPDADPNGPDPDPEPNGPDPDGPDSDPNGPDPDPDEPSADPNGPDPDPNGPDPDPNGPDPDPDEPSADPAEPDAGPTRPNSSLKPTLALAKFSGKLQVQRERGWRPWTGEDAGGLAWRVGDVLRARSTARITLPDGTRVSIERGATLTLDAVQPVTLSLGSGDVYCHVVRKTRAQGSKTAGVAVFVVRTPDVHVEVMGTEFGVGRSGGRTTVAVASGQVRCRNDAGQVSVPAGLGLRLRKGQAPPTPKPLDAGKAFAWTRRLRPPEEGIFRFDFEAGQTPASWDNGDVVRGPRRARSRFCLETSTYSLPVGIAVNLAIPLPQQVRAGRRILRFRYFTRGTSILVQLKNQDYGDNCRFTETAPAQGRWEWIEIPAEAFLAQTKGKPDPSRPIRGGHRIAFLQILFSGTDDAPSYVDDVEWVEILGR